MRPPGGGSIDDPMDASRRTECTESPPRSLTQQSFTKPQTLKHVQYFFCDMKAHSLRVFSTTFLFLKGVSVFSFRKEVDGQPRVPWPRATGNIIFDKLSGMAIAPSGRLCLLSNPWTAEGIKLQPLLLWARDAQTPLEDLAVNQ